MNEEYEIVIDRRIFIIIFMDEVGIRLIVNTSIKYLI